MKRGKMSGICGVFFLLMIVVFSPGVSAAGEKPGRVLRVPKVEGDLRVNGIMDEAPWQQALKLELKYEYDPGENIAPPVRTEVFIAYTKTHLYVGFRAYDRDISAVRARLTDRDKMFEDDWVGINLDTFNDQRRSYSFYCNPLGIQAELVETRSGQNLNWDAIWWSAGRLTAEGYVVEMAIPFSSLRFQRRKGEQVWGFDAVRSYPRGLAHYFGLFPRDRSNNCYMCQMTKVTGFEGARPGKQIEFDPSLSAVVTQEREADTGTFVEKDKRFDPGLTARWGFTPNMTLSAAVNPDFSHVEADVAQLDINVQFALDYPEKRPFFLEGVTLFETGLRAVYTRSLADPDWGVKLTGKEGPHAIGFYSVRDNITNLLFPGSRSAGAASLDMKTMGTVLRYRYDLGTASTVGLLVTDREGKYEGSDYYNRLAGVDAFLRLNRKKHVKAQLLGSWSRYPQQVVERNGQPAGKLTGTAMDLLFRHESRDFGYYVSYRQVSPDFRADLGFMPQVGFRNITGVLIFASWRDPGHWYTFINCVPAFEYEVDYNGDLIYKTFSINSYYAGPVQSEVSLTATLGKQSYMGEIFNTNHVRGRFSIQPSAVFQVGLSGIFGDHIDFANSQAAVRLRLNPFINYKMGRHLSIQLDHLYERLNVDAGRLYTANVTNLKAVFQFSRRAFLRTVLQYIDYKYNVENYGVPPDPTFKHLFTQVLFSYKINPQTMFFLGYSDDYYGYLYVPLQQANRTVFLKIGYALVM